MNPLAILKGAKIFLMIGTVIFALTVLKTCEKNRIEERNAAIAANAEKVTAQANAAALATANAQLEAITKATNKALEDAARAQDEVAAEFAEIKKGQAEQKALLEGDRLQKAIRSKRELVENAVNKATRERFDEVEEIFNN
jgi:hypothetical protein